MAPGLGDDPRAGIHQDNRQIGGGGAGDHVAGILFVTGSIGDNKFTFRGGKITISHIDGDPLLPLSFEPVKQQGVVYLTTNAAHPLAITLESGQLVVIQQLAVIQQAADEG